MKTVRAARHCVLTTALATIAGVLISGGAHAQAASAPAPAAGKDSSSVEQLFNQTCAACHGAGGTGGDRAPPLVNSPHLRSLPDERIKAIIHEGTPGGMPPFGGLPETELARLAAFIRSNNVSAARSAPAQNIAAGERIFFGTGACSQCHMVGGRGGVNGPDLSSIALRSSEAEIERMLDDPTSQIGVKTTSWCPGWAFCPDTQWAVVDVLLRDGTSLRGFARNRGEHDLQLQTLDGKIRLLTENDYVSIAPEAQSFMPPFHGNADDKRDLLDYLGSLSGVPLGPIALKPAAVTAADVEAIEHPAVGDWPSYERGLAGNRYSPLAQITAGNAASLQAQWIFAPGGVGLQDTPVVLDGIMYVTGATQVCALDARTGRSIWCTARVSGQSEPAGGADSEPASHAPRPVKSAGAAPAGGAPPFGGTARGNGPNRGVAVLGSRLYFVSDDAYLVCLNRVTGGVMWTVPLTDPAYKGRYHNTAAPMVVGDLIVSGVAGGDSPLRGFLVAFKATTGELAWRLWTIPKPGEKGSETWKGTALPTGGGATWTTGSYDPAAKLLYWAIGNPFPSTNGRERTGKNLYTNSVVAVDPGNGSIKWYFQFTPHDLHDWDSSSPLVLANVPYDGRDRKLLLQANRNGYFYVLDRLTGQFLLGKPFVKKLNWSSGIGPDGVPKLLPANEPSPQGTLTCPSVRGATNWYASSYSPQTDLFYVMAAEDCSIYRSSDQGFGAYRNPAEPGTRFLRALNVETGKIVWETPLVGAQEANYSGVLSTAGGLVFYGETGGRFAAADARSGRILWTFPTNDFWRAAPMTYAVDGRQYVAVAAGSNLIAFALPAKTPGP
jgi:PQQ-dependent dehydrogenase (methanol/ethanol family)